MSFSTPPPHCKILATLVLLFVSAYLHFFAQLFAFLLLVRKKTNNCFENKNKILQLIKSGYIDQRDFDRKTFLTFDYNKSLVSLATHSQSINFIIQYASHRTIIINKAVGNYRTVGQVVFNLQL